MRRYGLAFVAFAAFGLWWSLPAKHVDPEAEGVWRVEWTQSSGMYKCRKQAIWVIRSGAVRVFPDVGPFPGAAGLDPTKAPRQITSRSILVQFGIYQISSDEMLVAQAPDKRPEEFGARDDNLRTITFLRRIQRENRLQAEEIEVLLKKTYGPEGAPLAPMIDGELSPRAFIRKQFMACNRDFEQGHQDTPDYMIYNVEWMMTELNNGGMDQYFWNSTGDRSEDTARQLRMVGAVKTARAIELGRAVFPEGRPEVDALKRRAQMKSFTPEQKERITEAESAFADADEDVYAMLKAYLDQPRTK